MADYIVKDTELTSVANAIRTAGGTNSLLSFPNGFVSAVGNISGGGGSSDFSTATVTVEADDTYYWACPVLTNDGVQVNSYEQTAEHDTQTVVLYKGVLKVYDYMADHVVSGSATLADNVWTITGDCTLAVGAR